MFFKLRRRARLLWLNVVNWCFMSSNTLSSYVNILYLCEFVTNILITFIFRCFLTFLRYLFVLAGCWFQRGVIAFCSNMINWFGRPSVIKSILSIIYIRAILNFIWQSAWREVAKVNINVFQLIWLNVINHVTVNDKWLGAEIANIV